MLSRAAFCTWLVLGASGAWACGSDKPSPQPRSPQAGRAGSGGNHAAGGSSAGRSSQGGLGGTAAGSGAPAAGMHSAGASHGGRPPTAGSSGAGTTAVGGSTPDLGGGAGGEGGNAGSDEMPPNNGGDSGAPDAGCTHDEDCPGQRCNTTTRSCVACLPDSGDDCAANQYCDGADFTCKIGCKDNASCTSGLCKTDHVCAECNPSGTDTCVTGSYCSSAGACTPGCKADGSGCASGVCLSNHECSSCIADSECTDGHVCSTGTCMPHCEHDACSGAATCCTDRCAELSHDHDNCLACGNACSGNQFCGNSGCLAATLASVCASDTATFLLDGLSVDEATVPSVRDAFTATCLPSVAPLTASQASAGTINASSGRPVVGSGNLQVVVGGTYGQRLISYLESSGLTTVYNSYVGTTAQFNVRSGSSSNVVVTAPESVLTDSHSYFVIETVVDPATGTLTLALYGFTSPGTAAAAWYFVNEMLPALASFDESYYVYEWTDGDADLAPGAADTFTLVVSGP